MLAAANRSEAPPGIGKRLRRARTAKHLSIEEMAWRTRVRPDVLRAIECEQFSVLEQPGFVKRLLGSYARLVDLDPAEIVAEYEQRHEPAQPSPIEQLDDRERKAERPPRSKWHIAAAISAVLLALSGVVGVLGSDPTVEQAASTSAPRLDEIAEASRRGSARVRLTLEATATAHASVVVDGKRAFEGTLEGGDRRSYFGRRWVEVVLGNASAVRFRLNGKAVPADPPAGTVYRVRFGPTGVISS